MKPGAQELVMLGLLWAASLAAAFGQSQANSCPIKILRLDLVPDTHSPTSNVLQIFELRLKYQNVGTKDIKTGNLELETMLRGENGSQRGIRVVELDGPIFRGQKKTTRVPQFSDLEAPNASLRDVVFSDGSRWIASDAHPCTYAFRKRKIIARPFQRPGTPSPLRPWR